MHDAKRKKMPARISAIVDKIIDEVRMDPVGANLDWAWDDDPLALVTLTNEEFLGKDMTGLTVSEILVNRKLIGHSIDPNQLVLCSRFSLMLHLKISLTFFKLIMTRFLVRCSLGRENHLQIWLSV